MNTYLNTLTTKTALAFATIMIAGSALAAPATATNDVNVRTGPGTSYSKVDQLHAGENVDVTECQGSWCYVEHSGPDGWVAKNYLSLGGGIGPSDGGGNPFEDCGVAVGPGGFAIGCGEGAPTSPPPAPPPLPPVFSKICFYSLANYHGSSFCVKPGHGNIKMFGFWNNRISSIRVYGAAKAKVCNGWNMTGMCSFVTSSRPHLFGLNNHISSYWVQ